MTSSNCNACGNEFGALELKTLQVPKLGVMSLCEKCLSKTAGQSYEDASGLINDIEKIAKTKRSPEERLKLIKELLSGNNRS